MNVPTVALDLMRSFEGCSLFAYRDPVGVPTIGYGHALGVKMGDVVTQAQANALFAADVAIFARGVERMVKVPLTDNQFGALVSLAFNIGLAAFSRSTLLRRVNAGNFEQVPAEFSKWVNAGGRRLAGLVRRRAAEAELFGA